MVLFNRSDALNEKNPRNAYLMSGFTLSGRTIAAYALPTIPLAALALPLVVYVAPFYITGLGLDQASVGAVLLIARLLDLLVDPFIGWMGDSTRTRWGRRRPWIVASVPPFVIGVYLLFIPPEGATISYFAAFIILSYLAYSVATISHIAWGAELSGQYHERSRIQGWREFASVSGLILVLALPVILENLVEGATVHDKLFAMGWFVCISLPVTVSLLLMFVPEPSIEETGHRKLEIAAAIRLIVGNATLRRLLLADLFAGLAPGITGALFIWMVSFYYELPAYASTLLFIYFISGLVFIPLWIQLSYKISKHRTFCVALLYNAALSPLILLLPKGDFLMTTLLFIALGVSYGAAGFLLRSIMADVIDVDTLATGSERAGLFYSLLVMTSKLGVAAAGLVYPILSVFGFDGRLGMDNGPDAIQNMAYVFVGLPWILVVATAAVMWNFPIDQFKQQEIREAIARNRLAAAKEIEAIKMD